MGSNKPNASSRPLAGQVPAWTYRLGALVAGLTLAWTVVSHFVPRAETPPAPPPPPKPPVETAEVHAVGQGSVAVGAMSGGSITVGEAPKASGGKRAAVAKAASGPR